MSAELRDFVDRCDHTTERVYVAALNGLIEQYEEMRRQWDIQAQAATGYFDELTSLKEQLEALRDALIEAEEAGTGVAWWLKQHGLADFLGSIPASSSPELLPWVNQQVGSHTPLEYGEQNQERKP